MWRLAGGLACLSIPRRPEDYLRADAGTDLLSRCTPAARRRPAECLRTFCSKAGRSRGHRRVARGRGHARRWRRLRRTGQSQSGRRPQKTIGRGSGRLLRNSVSLQTKRSDAKTTTYSRTRPKQSRSQRPSSQVVRIRDWCSVSMALGVLARPASSILPSAIGNELRIR